MGEIAAVPAQSTNYWRALGKVLGIPAMGDVVKIPDLTEALFDPVPYQWDQGEFNVWFKKYFSGRPVNPKDVYPEWRFCHRLTVDGRKSLVLVYAKLKYEGLWSEVETVRWVGETAEITFFARKGSVGLRQYLLTKGYGDWWSASHKCKWGVRSRFRGAQLHFRGFQDPKDPTNVHIDLHNPGDPPTGEVTGGGLELGQAIGHLIKDDWERSKTHRPDTVLQALRTQLLTLPLPAMVGCL